MMHHVLGAALILLSVSMKAGIAEVAYEGQPADLHCCESISVGGRIAWYNETYRNSEPTKSQGTRIAIYNNPSSSSVPASYTIDPPWKERGVELSRSDGHLTIPVVQLSDEAGYTWELNGLTHGGVTLEVYVRPSELSVSPSVAMPVDINSTISVSCLVDHIKPLPADFYWDELGERREGVRTENVIDTIYNVYAMNNTYTTSIGERHEGQPLTCVVKTFDGQEIRRSVMVDIKDFVVPTESDDAVDAIIPIVAGVCGGVVIMVIVITAIVCVLRRKKSVPKTNGAVTKNGRLGNAAEGPSVAYAEVKKPTPASRKKPNVTTPEPEYIYSEPVAPPVPPYLGAEPENVYQEVAEAKNNNRVKPPPEVNYADLDSRALNMKFKPGPPKPPRYQPTEYAQVDFNKDAQDVSVRNFYANENPYYND